MLGLSDYEKYLIKLSILTYIEKTDFVLKNVNFYSMNETVKESFKKDKEVLNNILRKINFCESNQIIRKEEKENEM